MRTGLVVFLICGSLLLSECARGSEETFVEVRGPTISPDGQSVVFNLCHGKRGAGLFRGALGVCPRNRSRGTSVGKRPGKRGCLADISHKTAQIRALFLPKWGTLPHENITRTDS